MRIGFFRDGQFLPPHQGGSNSIYNMMNALIDKGEDVFLFRCFRGWDNPEWYKKEKFTTIFIKSRDFYQNSNLMRKLVINNKIQVCQFDSAEATLIQGKYLKDIAKVCWEVHNVNHILQSRLGVDRESINNTVRIERNASEIADLLLVRSEADKQELADIGISNQKMTVYRGSISAKEINFKLLRDGKNIIFVGNLKYKPNENAVRLICKTIAPLVISRYPDVRFLIAGPLNSPLQKGLAVPSNVVFLGEIAELGQLYDSATVALCPVLEGSGTRIKILEYLAAGIPTISTSIGIEGLENEIKELLTVEDNIIKYPRLINRIISNPNKYRSTIESGRKFVLKNRDWNFTIYDVIDAYKSMLTP
ncbi:glycosyltransferase family 4 protein [Candidatus Amesbacteria bacterium]|nr:glycosyltransferase family 4 protein [Candidatus Amesbacteria bacterium]